MNTIAHVKDLRLKFPQSSKLLFNHLSFSIQKGEKVLLLGPSGCGKSTLLQVLSGLIPYSIEVPMRAEELLVPESWGYVFQDPDTQFCMPFTDEEIAFSLENLQVPREEMSARIRELLAAVNLPFSNPHTEIRTLSGGMKQRLAIASTLALDPEVLFLDEPTAMLDPKGTKEVWDTIRKTAINKTLVIVEHKLDHMLDLINRIVLFNSKGQIIADGPKDTIFKTHHRQIQEKGIWYPGAWEKYWNENSSNFFRSRSYDNEKIRLINFKGYIQKEQKIDIPYVNVKSGEWIAITGANGAGKTTLLYAFMQLIQTSGRYWLNDILINHNSNITDYISLVFQNPEHQFLTNSVYDEMAFSISVADLPEDVINERVEELLSLFLLTNLKYQHPYQLSMGQKRRLSVATALMKKVPLLLLDEPTFGLDARNTFRLLELLEKYRQEGMTILMTTHDENIANYVATRVWAIKKGKLIKDFGNGRRGG